MQAPPFSRPPYWSTWFPNRAWKSVDATGAGAGATRQRSDFREKPTQRLLQDRPGRSATGLWNSGGGHCRYKNPILCRQHLPRRTRSRIRCSLQIGTVTLAKTVLGILGRIGDSTQALVHLRVELLMIAAANTVSATDSRGPVLTILKRRQA